MEIGSLSNRRYSNPVRRLLWRLVAPYFKQNLTDFATHGETRLQTLEASLRATIASKLDRSTLASELNGLRKDTNAFAFRLSGLEEEAAGGEQMRAKLAGRMEEHDAGLANLRQALQRIMEEHDAGLATLREALQRIDATAQGAPIRPGQCIAVGNSGLVIVQTTLGAQMLVRPQDHIGHIIADGREWEPHVREAIERAARPDGVAIDAGAYIGVHTVTMARSFGSVHAFEPQHGIYQVLCGNLALNGCLNVVAHNDALYDRAGFVRLAPQGRQETAMPLKDGQPDYPHIANAAALSFDFETDDGDVRAVAIDNFALDAVRLIKVDTQGADLHVLQGAADTIGRCRPTVLFEWERDLALQHDTTLENFFDFFSGLKYEVTMIHDTTPGRQADYIAKPR
jgi:FkbM family methyltransferase